MNPPGSWAPGEVGEFACRCKIECKVIRSVDDFTAEAAAWTLTPRSAARSRAAVRGDGEGAFRSLARALPSTAPTVEGWGLLAKPDDSLVSRKGSFLLFSFASPGRRRPRPDGHLAG